MTQKASGKWVLIHHVHSLELDRQVSFSERTGSAKWDTKASTPLIIPAGHLHCTNILEPIPHMVNIHDNNPERPPQPLILHSPRRLSQDWRGCASGPHTRALSLSSPGPEPAGKRRASRESKGTLSEGAMWGLKNLRASRCSDEASLTLSCCMAFATKLGSFGLLARCVHWRGFASFEHQRPKANHCKGKPLTPVLPHLFIPVEGT